MEFGIAPICSSVPSELSRDTQNEARNLSEGAWGEGGREGEREGGEGGEGGPFRRCHERNSE